MKVTDRHVLFWGGVFSNWQTVPKGITYVDKQTGEIIKFSSSEQLFMYLKAAFFGDYEIAEELTHTTDPKEAKKLGRKIKGFSEVEWEKVREDIMYEAVSYKAQFYPLFKDSLLAYGNREFVEASPFDKVWGIGIAEDDPRADNEGEWEGLNLLGKTLTRLRDDLKK